MKKKSVTHPSFWRCEVKKTLLISWMRNCLNVKRSLLHSLMWPKLLHFVCRKTTHSEHCNRKDRGRGLQKPNCPVFSSSFSLFMDRVQPSEGCMLQKSHADTMFTMSVPVKKLLVSWDADRWTNMPSSSPASHLLLRSGADQSRPRTPVSVSAESLSVCRKWGLCVHQDTF